MDWPRIGRVNYINCLPVFYALEQEHVPLPAKIVAEHPSVLNALFQQGDLEVTAVSSLAYGMFMQDALVLPGLSISSRGPVGSVLLASRVPIENLSGCSLSLTPYSATSVVLLRILLEKFYEVKPNFVTRPSGSDPDWEQPEAVLTIGDEALRISWEKRYPYIYDLGEQWHKFTGKPMVFALWVTRRDFPSSHSERLQNIWQAMQTAKVWGKLHPGSITTAATQNLGLAPEFLEEYFTLLNFDLEWSHLEGLNTFYRLAYELGLLSQPVALDIWGGENEGYYRMQSSAK